MENNEQITNLTTPLIPTLAPCVPTMTVTNTPQNQAQVSSLQTPNGPNSLTPNITNSTPTLNASLPQYQIPPTVQSGTSKYTQLLSMIDELGKDIRPTYNANRNCSDRLKRSIQHARGLVRECMAELEKNARMQQQQQNSQNNSL